MGELENIQQLYRAMDKVHVSNGAYRLFTISCFDFLQK